ncbi:MAG: BrnT family toxin [gamma proteobacterium symbiont of Taylorina sp.]|nr:BrnT family toxin [gamma proteobacterium symbiont of Taylorina sp.]
MEITYDIQKDQINIAKHQGISLSEAQNIEWDTLYAVEDQRFNYGEIRMLGYAFMSDRLYCVVFTDRGNQRRIISLRKANNREKKAYVLNY